MISEAEYVASLRLVEIDVGQSRHIFSVIDINDDGILDEAETLAVFNQMDVYSKFIST